MNFNHLFYPKSICLVGSSKIREKGNLISPEVFHNISYNLKEFFKGQKWVVDTEKNEKIPKVYLLVISLPEEKTLRLIDDLDCEVCIILPGNYSHKKLLTQMMKERQIRFLGPNSVCGVMNTDNGLNTTFERGLFPRKGYFSLITQSGGVGASLLDLSISNFTGIAKLIWLGNAWDIGFSDLIEYLSHDRQTRSMGLYIEGLEDGKKFIKTTERVNKPIIALKGGVTEQGAKRALSHTSSLSGSHRIYSSVFKQTGIVEAQSIEELYEFCHALSQKNEMKKPNIAIVSNVGGPCILASDYAHKYGLNLAEFSERTVKRIKKEYPTLSVINPLDLIADADAERYEFCLNQVLNDKNIDAVLVINMMKSCTLKSEETKKIARIIKRSKKPIVDCVPAFDDWQKIREVMNREGVYVFDDLEKSIETLRAIYEYNMFRVRL